MHKKVAASLCVIAVAALISFFAWRRDARTLAISSSRDAAKTEQQFVPPPPPVPIPPPPQFAPTPYSYNTDIAPFTPPPIQATVVRGDKPYSPKFFSGHSERLAAKPNEAIPIQVSWPSDTTSSGVFIQAVHGGRIDSATNHKTVMFDKDKSASFTFTPDSSAGTYEVLMRRGTTEESLSFWVSTGDPHDPPTR